MKAIINARIYDFKNYIDKFHKEVFTKLSPFLKNDEKALNYLKKKLIKVREKPLQTLMPFRFRRF